MSLDAVRAYGEDAVSFQSLESGMQWWRDDAAPVGTGAVLAFVDTGRSWIAVGTPLIDSASKGAAVDRFARASRAAGRRAIFFGVEDVGPFSSCRHLRVGRQSVLRPSQWPATLRTHPRLREQVRRAKAKGVVVRIAGVDEMCEHGPLRAHVERLKAEWLSSRRMEPMTFLVAVEPFHAPGEHVYVVAERHGEPVQFLSAVPIYTRGGWLMEDMLRGPDAPNGTTELVLNRLMQELGPDTPWVTPGLTPLAGEMPWWLRAVRVVMSPLYDFAGLQRFRARLSPEQWNPVWIAWDRGRAPLIVIEILRAFAGGSLVAFAWRSLIRHPGGPPWAVAVPLVAWTVLLAMLALGGHAALLGFSTAVLWWWVVFDVMMAAVLFRAAQRPRVRRLGIATAFATFDMVLSLQHLAQVGLGSGALQWGLRLVATTGPIVGVAALLWSIGRARRTR